MIGNFFERLGEVLSTVWGWILCLIMVVVDYVTGYGMMVNIAVMRSEEHTSELQSRI